MNAPTVGSQILLQRVVEHRPELMRSALRRAGALGRGEPITWKSPVALDGYRECRDAEALQRLGLTGLHSPLSGFWPSRGPVWDALGIAGAKTPVLVEAKAHIPEAASPRSKASPKSKELIDRSLLQARRYYSPRSKADWSATFYQYANRLAYQFFLREKNSIPSRLVFLYFTNAADVDGPASEQEWHGAVRLLHAQLGLPTDLRRFGVFEVFVDARAVLDAA